MQLLLEVLLTPAGVDYLSTTATLTFPAGSGPGTVDCISVQIIDDFILEDVETFGVVVQSIESSLGPGSPPIQNILVTQSSTLVTITDDESEEIAHSCIPTHYYTLYTVFIQIEADMVLVPA